MSAPRGNLVTEIASSLLLISTLSGWALSLGACLGGNGTFIADTANLVEVNILKRQGRIITFKDFFPNRPSDYVNLYYSIFCISLLKVFIVKKGGKGYFGNQQTIATDMHC